jgi:hypothetical protein
VISFGGENKLWRSLFVQVIWNCGYKRNGTRGRVLGSSSSG